jgi:hypothetical protein
MQQVELVGSVECLFGADLFLIVCWLALKMLDVNPKQHIASWGMRSK